MYNHEGIPHTTSSSTTSYEHKKRKQPFLIVSFCGESGIRTPGPVTVNSFQDCRNRPLCQLSSGLQMYNSN